MFAMEKREVEVSKWNKVSRERELRAKGTFLQFAQDSEEGNTYPVAIVEFEDGSVEAIPLCLIRFVKDT